MIDGRLSFDLNLEVLLTGSETLLPMLIKEDLKTTVDKAHDDTLRMSMRGDLKIMSMKLMMVGSKPMEQKPMKISS